MGFVFISLVFVPQHFLIMPPVSRNQNGGFFCNETYFNSVKWTEIIEAYTHLLQEENGKSTIRQLALYSKVSCKSARKAILPTIIMRRPHPHQSAKRRLWAPGLDLGENTICSFISSTLSILEDQGTAIQINC